MSEQSESALDKLLDSEKWDDDSYGACCRCPVSMLDLEAARAELERLRRGGRRMTSRVISYGGGVNSTALVIECVRRGLSFDLVLFADTGGERPETYLQVESMSAWLLGHGLLPVVTVHYASRHGTLEQECLNNGTLPSLAFGFRGCSVKWKRQPMDSYLREWPPYLRGEKIERLIGIHAGESHRGKIADDEHFSYRFPLIEWDLDQEGCVEAIRAAGMNVPSKSACWFCPAMKKGEVRALAAEAPELYARAVAMERNARHKGGLDRIKGLGRHWSWEELTQRGAMPGDLFHGLDIPCMCWDGSVEP